MKAFYLVSFLLVSSVVHAAPGEDCEGWKHKASLFMNWRQQGVPISEAVKDTSGNISRGLLLRAYGEPVVQGYEAQYAVIDDFSQKIYSECLSEQHEPVAD